MTRILGFFLFVGSLGCAGWAFLEAGGGHGLAGFRASELFSRNDAPVASALAIGLCVLSIVMMIVGAGRKRQG